MAVIRMILMLAFIVMVVRGQYTVSELYSSDFIYNPTNCTSQPVLVTINKVGKCLNRLITYCDFNKQTITIINYSDDACKTQIYNTTGPYNASQCILGVKVYCTQTYPSYSFGSYNVKGWAKTSCGGTPDEEVISRLGVCLPGRQIYTSNCSLFVDFNDANCTSVNNVHAIYPQIYNYCAIVNGIAGEITCNAASALLNPATLLIALLVFIYHTFISY